MIKKWHEQIFKNDKSPYNLLETTCFAMTYLDDGKLVTG